MVGKEIGSQLIKDLVVNMEFYIDLLTLLNIFQTFSSQCLVLFQMTPNVCPKMTNTTTNNILVEIQVMSCKCSYFIYFHADEY